MELNECSSTNRNKWRFDAEEKKVKMKKSQDEKIDPVVASVMALQVMVADEL